jgi:hypothetical protein
MWRRGALLVFFDVVLAGVVPASAAGATRPPHESWVLEGLCPSGSGSCILFDQAVHCDELGFSSQWFVDLGGGIDVADDFVVPVLDMWLLTGVAAPGFFEPFDAGPLGAVNVTVWSNSLTLPGQVLCSYPARPTIGLTASTLAVELDPPCQLSPGIYWIQVQAVMPFAGGQGSGQWFWRESNTSFGNEFAFRDPMQIVESGCPAWSDTCRGDDPQDLCFVLSGVGTGLLFADGFESGSASTWSVVVP